MVKTDIQYDDNFEYCGVRYGDLCETLKHRHEEIKKNPKAFNPRLDCNTFFLESLKLDMESRMRGLPDIFDVAQKAWIERKVANDS